MNIVAVMLGCLIDNEFGEPKKLHPLVGFGWLANKIENVFNRDRFDFENSTKKSKFAKFYGSFAALLLVLPIVSIASFTFTFSPLLNFAIGIIIFYLCIGASSLKSHAMDVYKALNQEDIQLARKNVGKIVSRDTESMDSQDITKATIESVLENSNDSIYGSIFWFMIAGIPGVLLHRLFNTLDAMWGYKTSRYQHFGWFSAKMDDWLNWIPSRMTAYIFLLTARFIMGSKSRFQAGKDCWQTQAKYCSSPNGGPVMTTGAGVLGIRLGGLASYHGEAIKKPVMGCGRDVENRDIINSIQLVHYSLLVWVFIGAFIEIFIHVVI